MRLFSFWNSWPIRNKFVAIIAPLICPELVKLPSSAFAGPDSSITLCILGKDPFGARIKAIEGKAVHGRQLVVERHRRENDLGGCRSFFVSTSEKKQVPRILDVVKERHMLTVGDSEGFAEQGGTINLIQEVKKIRFEINPSAAEAAGLVLSSKLLSLAQLVADSRLARDRVEGD